MLKKSKFMVVDNEQIDADFDEVVEILLRDIEEMHKNPKRYVKVKMQDNIDKYYEIKKAVDDIVEESGGGIKVIEEKDDEAWTWSIQLLGKKLETTQIEKFFNIIRLCRCVDYDATTDGVFKVYLEIDDINVDIEY